MMKLVKFRKEIEEIINKNQLNIDEVYYVMKDIMNDISILYVNELKKLDDKDLND